MYQGTEVSCTLCTLAAKEASWVRMSRMMSSMYRCEGARPEAVYSICAQPIEPINVALHHIEFSDTTYMLFAVTSQHCPAANSKD